MEPNGRIGGKFTASCFHRVPVPAVFSRFLAQGGAQEAVRKLGLVTKDGERFFEAIHKSGNRFLVRNHFRMVQKLLMLSSIGANPSYLTQCVIKGSAHDTTILNWSRRIDQIPKHYYVLADAGYGLSDKALTPFRGVRCHLKEWAQWPSGRPQNAKELFNLRHAKARNVAERVIGMLKRRFKVLRSCMDFELMTIKTVISACVLVHNFIREHDANDVGDDFRRVRHPPQRVHLVSEVVQPIPFDFEKVTTARILEKVISKISMKWIPA
ncbi:Transposase [Phytophthora palmivora]|uniref:Transposase n=1 Tax=Phytophthora palmivora TaxID=4796 RepID=A0A2P4YTP3_9STRA|nr:Transposase [Phytophthora palmivora]